jgi:hypothetical protein
MRRSYPSLGNALPAFIPKRQCAREIGQQTPRLLQCLTALLAVLAVATALIAPTIDIPDTVLPGHCVSAHAGSMLFSGAASIATAAGAIRAFEGLSAFHVFNGRNSLQLGYSAHTIVMRC